MARTYKRDANGRFAGGGGGGGSGGGRRKSVKLPAPAARKVGSKPQRRRGLLIDRAAVKSTKAKLAAKDPADKTIKGQLSRRSQKGAVTKASNALAAAKQSGRVRLSGRSGVIRPGAKKGAQPKGKIDAGVAAARASDLRARADRLEQRGNALMSGGSRDSAATNIPFSSRTRRNETNAGFRGMDMTRQAAELRGKASRVEQRAAQSAAKAAREAAKPKRTRTPESLRMSRAKQVEKRRGMSMNPAASWDRPASIDRMAANAARTQQRALAFYKSGGAANSGARKAASTRPAARVDGDAFAARMKRARGASLRRGINESDRENALTGSQRRSTAPSKRFAASNQRQARSERTAAAAQAFYRSYGSPSAFGSRTRQSTAASPNFGSKRRGRRR
jgi:hypothetical protein